MTRVAQYAAPTPTTMTPSNHACGVNSGSCPMVRSNAHAARTDTVNCMAFTPPTLSNGGSYR
jgi:hypothetical protein